MEAAIRDGRAGLLVFRSIRGRESGRPGSIAPGVDRERASGSEVKAPRGVSNFEPNSAGRRKGEGGGGRTAAPGNRTPEAPVRSSGRGP